MTAITRRSVGFPVSAVSTLATADDLNGTVDNSQAFDVTGAHRIIVETRNDGTDGTAGIDVIEISHDDGATWTACLTVLPIDANDNTGTIQAGGVLNSAGIEAYATFKLGPYEGPTAIRCGRKTSTITSMDTYDKTLTAGTDWITGAPTVRVYTIGQTSGELSAV